MPGISRVSIVVAVACVCVPVSAQPEFHRETYPGRNAGASGQGARRTEEASGTSAVATLLARSVDHVAWDRAPLGEVLEWLARESTRDVAVTVAPHWHALQKIGVDDKTPVRLEMRRTTVKEVLTELLAGLSLDDPLVYLASGEHLEITTRSDMRRELVTATYDVRDLLVHIPDEEYIDRGTAAYPAFLRARMATASR